MDIIAILVVDWVMVVLAMSISVIRFACCQSSHGSEDSAERNNLEKRTFIDVE